MSMFAGGIFLGGIVAIASITMVILLGIWTYKDAENKGMIPLLWTAVVVLVPSFIGLIVYLIVRTDNSKVVCSNCKTRVNSNIKFCSNCGYELSPAQEDAEQQAAFKSGQKKLLIGIFSALAVNIICGVMMVVFFIIGGLHMAERVVDWTGRAIDWTNEIDIDDLSEDITDALSEFDRALGDEDINISIKDDQVIITNDDGEEIIHIDGDSEEVNINGKEIRKYMKDRGLDIDDSSISDEDIEELKESIQDAIENAIEESKDGESND